jgi:hypothetical protein
MCVSDTSVCRGKVCVGDKSSRGHVSLNHGPAEWMADSSGRSHQKKRVSGLFTKPYIESMKKGVITYNKCQRALSELVTYLNSRDLTLALALSTPKLRYFQGRPIFIKMDVITVHYTVNKKLRSELFTLELIFACK